MNFKINGQIVQSPSCFPDHGLDSLTDVSKLPKTPQNGDKIETHSAKRKRRRINAWSKGLVVKRARTSNRVSESVLSRLKVVMGGCVRVARLGVFS